MPVRIWTVTHALPSPDAATTKCGLSAALGTRTKGLVTCPECKRIGAADFSRGWDAAIARGVTGDEPDEEEEATMATERPIETTYLRVPGDRAALEEFLARVEADLARADGGIARWPALAEDVERAVALARARLAEGDGR